MGNNSKDFLIEIGCEELPVGSPLSLGRSLLSLLTAAFKQSLLKHEEAKIYSTPRRIAVLITALDARRPPQEKVYQGPSYESSFDAEGRPTPVAIGFAHSCGVSVKELEVLNTPKGKRLVCRIKEPSQPTIQLLPDLIHNAVKKLPLPKSMRWGSHTFSFIRPVRWVLVLYGGEVVPCTLFGQKSGRQTRGHRFHKPDFLSIFEPGKYQASLTSEGYVIPDYDLRRGLIQEQIKKAAAPDYPLIDQELLNEVTDLVEWPKALAAHFHERFLALPPEVLITSMKTHLRCFPVADAKSNLLSKFVVVSNIESPNPQAILLGNQKVINARLTDAEFFYQNDLKTSLEKRLPRLEQVVFERQLGCMEEKSQRISLLSRYVAEETNAAVSISEVVRAALLSKCDLVTEMVTEFPSLQGIMGFYYAQHDGETKDCALAIKEHYLPKFSGDSLPSSLGGCLLSLADRIDTIVGILGFNKHPTGDKDPFGLRRLALGMIRILVEKEVPLNLPSLISYSMSLYATQFPNVNLINDVIDFIYGRLKSWYQEKGVPVDVFESVQSCNPPCVLDFNRRIIAVQHFKSLPEAKTLCEVNKRVNNILRKSSEETVPDFPHMDLFEQREEYDLLDCIREQQESIDLLYKKTDYTTALAQLASLKSPVDAFFDKVMVMHQDKKKRLNRLALLASLRRLFTKIADLSFLQ